MLKAGDEINIEINGKSLTIKIKKDGETFEVAEVIKYASNEGIIQQNDAGKEIQVLYFDEHDNEKIATPGQAIDIYDGIKFEIKINDDIEIKVNDTPKKIPGSDTELSYSQILDIAIEYGFTKPKDGDLPPEIYYRDENNKLIYMNEGDKVEVKDGMEFTVEYGDDS